MGEAVLHAALLLDATARGATPLVLAALGGLFAERSGVVDIGLEGKMLAAAFAAAATAAVTGSAWAGLGAGIARALDPAFRRGLTGLRNPYGDGRAAPRIAAVLRTVELGPRLIRKRFVDLEPAG